LLCSFSSKALFAVFSKSPLPVFPPVLIGVWPFVRAGSTRYQLLSFGFVDLILFGVSVFLTESGQSIKFIALVPVFGCCRQSFALMDWAGTFFGLDFGINFLF